MAPKRKASASAATAGANAPNKRTAKAPKAPAATKASRPAPAPKPSKTAKPARSAPAKAKASTAKSKASTAGKAAKAVNATAAPKAGAVKAAGGAVRRPVDEACAQGGVAVVKDYDTMLNQTNIEANNNKFYRLQMLQDSASGRYMVWTRWGRVGVAGQSKMLGPFDTEFHALHAFSSKHKDKTGVRWDDRDSIEFKIGKYCPVELDIAAEAAKSPAKPAAQKKKTQPSKLPPATQELISLILDDAMFTSAMAEFEINTDELPLGQLSQDQVKKGLDILELLSNEVKKKKPSAAKLTELSNRFYQTIPHAFGFSRPPVISSMEAINAKVEVCNVLTDIEIAQQLQKDAAESEPDSEELPEHPTDVQYSALYARLDLVGNKDKEYAVIKEYVDAGFELGPNIPRHTPLATAVRHEPFMATKGWGAPLVDLWRVQRDEDDARFAKHRKLDNRRLLFHGTRVPVVAAVLKQGLRIMPYSGGRVGRGIYMASEHNKSIAYTTSAGRNGKKLGVMFLVEAALGKTYEIATDDHTLTKPPKGCHSVWARGQCEPDPKKDTTLKLGGKAVAVPQGSPIPADLSHTNAVNGYSSFSQSEYLVYDESQVTIRYMATFDFLQP